MRRLPAVLAVCWMCAGYAVAAEGPEQPADEAVRTEAKAAQDSETAKPAASEADARSEPGTEADVKSEADADIKPEPGNLKETVNRSLKLFVPSEEIDVDKPVDFPTNI